MFDNAITTFMQVVKFGSFSKTAEALFLSPNAVKKRIKALEEQTGITLFIRSNRGVCLTKAGQALYNDFSMILEQYKTAVEKAQNIQNEPAGALRIGMMGTFLDTFMTTSWHEILRKLAQSALHIVHYGSSLSDMDALFGGVGRETDLCIDIYDPDLAQRYGLQARKVSTYNIYIGVPGTMGLLWSDKVSLEQLGGQTLFLPPRGRAEIYDTVWNQMKQLHLEIGTEEIWEYNIRTFNSCYINRHCILVAENQINLYPFFSFFPLDMDVAVSFGVYYPIHMDRQTEIFIDMITSAT